MYFLILKLDIDITSAFGIELNSFHLPFVIENKTCCSA